MDVSEADSIFINNILAYNFESDKLIKKAFHEVEDSIHKLNSDIAGAYKAKERIEKSRKRLTAILYLLTGGCILFIALFFIFFSNYLASKSKAAAAMDEVKQANENFANVSEEIIKLDRARKEEQEKSRQEEKKMNTLLSVEKQRIASLNNKIRLLEDRHKENSEDKNDTMPQNQHITVIPEKNKRDQAEDVEIRIMKLEKLKRLKDMGVITAEEFEEMKTKIVKDL